MGKIIVPKNHITTSTTNHTSTISTTSAILNANIAPEFLYIDGRVIIDRTINYTPTSGIIYATSNVNYRINLFDDTSEDDREVRFIKLTLSGFPVYRDNRSGTNLLAFSGSINIYKKSSSTSTDCSILISADSLDSVDVNGTYWLTFDTSTKKYSVTYPASAEPLLVSKAIVPNKDNWMDLSTTTPYSPSVGTQMTISTGDGCNQPYIGRMISVIRETTSNISVSANTIYKLTINTADKILGITKIYLGKFVGPVYPQGSLASSVELTFKIFINNNSTAVYTETFDIPGSVGNTAAIGSYITVNNLYIDVKNNKTIASADLSKAIDDF